MPSQRIFLIDGTAFCYRAFYAIRNLNTSNGRPTNAIYGFAMMLQALRDKERPDGLAVAFDVGKPTFRHQRFDQYKIQRKPMPDPLIGQIPIIKRLLAAYRIPIFEQEGYEGEDVLATIAKRIASEAVEVFLVTGDKDALQLVNAHIKVYNPHKEHTVLDADAVRSRYGIGPEQVVDLMALMGDETDNIPGAQGIGEKTAVELLKQFGSVDQLYRHLDDLGSAARRKTLEVSREQVELSRELARIDAQVPITVALENLKVQEPDWRALRTLFRELEFKRLLANIDQAAPTFTADNRIAAILAEGQGLEQCLERLADGVTASLGCWVWPSSAEAGEAALILAVSVDERSAWVMRVDQAIQQTPTGKRLARWLTDSKAPKIGHDLKTVYRLLDTVGWSLDGIVGDTMVAAYLLNPARINQSLNDLADEYLKRQLPTIPEAPPERKMSQREERLLSVDTMPAIEPYAEAVGTIHALHKRLTSMLQDHGLFRLYTELELLLVRVLAEMEAVGVAIDIPYLKGVHSTMEVQLAQSTQVIYDLAGTSFNLNSPKQLAQVLFERLRLPVVKRGKTGPSTDSDVLRQLAEHHPLPRQLMEYRELSKLVSTYVEALPKLADAKGRVHTSFNQTATATGRLSSSEPNLQNIPIKTELGRSIRRAFIPGIADGLLVAADYSQIELRILAHVSGDEQLTQAFREGRDIHRFTASLIYGMPEAEVQPEQRSAMKAVNFGILYGMTSHGLSKELGMNFEEAQAFIDAYFQRYPKVRGYLDQQIAQARRDGFVQTLMGRRRYIPEVNSPDMMIRQFGERMAINAPIQGTAADIIKRAMVQLADELARAWMTSRMVLQVHDELVFESPRHELEPLIRLVRRVMEETIQLSVPLTVTVKAGPNWLDLSPVE